MDVTGPELTLGWPTGIGSLPHDDVDAAVAFTLTTCPELPAAPTLPRRDAREGMLGQAAWGIAGVEVAADGSLVLDPAQLDPEAPVGDGTLAGPPFATLRAFFAAVAGRHEPMKLQLTGPVTLGLALQQAGAPTGLAFEIARSAVRSRAEALLAAAGEVAPDAPLVVFVDEPGLVTGLSQQSPLTADRTVDLVSGALATLEPHAVTGLHCCGPADWKVVLQAGPDMLSLPVSAGVGRAAGAVSSFVERGGWLAWGAVPTDGPLGDSVTRLWRHLAAQWCELVQAGCDPVLLRRQAIITPACGLATHTVGQADAVMALSRRLAERLHDQVAGINISVGA
jgi:methionine synthase II (cobalamin-independent)